MNIYANIIGIMQEFFESKRQALESLSSRFGSQVYLGCFVHAVSLFLTDPSASTFVMDSKEQRAIIKRSGDELFFTIPTRGKLISGLLMHGPLILPDPNLLSDGHTDGNGYWTLVEGDIWPAQRFEQLLEVSSIIINKGPCFGFDGNLAAILFKLRNPIETGNLPILP